MTLHQMIDSCSSIWALMDAEIEYPLEYSFHIIRHSIPEPCDPTGALGRGVTLSLA